MLSRWLWLAALATACGNDAPPRTPPIRFLHTFGPAETELFNALVAERGIAVESSLVPFARGQQVIGEILRAGTSCPDLIRIDATWLPGLRAELVPPPPELANLDWTPEALELAGRTAGLIAVPQSVDGLIVVRDRATPAPASASIDDLVAAARARRASDPARSSPSGPARSSPSGAAPSSGPSFPLGLRVDGYWLVPWLRADGADLAPGKIDEPGAVHALATFAALFGDVAAFPPPAGNETPDELRRWSRGELAYWVTGPWQLGLLPVAERERVAVGPLARAPRGGQLLVVPRCAKRPADGWRLAGELVSVPALVRFAESFATVPTRPSALAAAPPLASASYDALRSAEPLPRDRRTPLLFDDLNPALAAVIASDATPEEAIAGVRRGWRRLAATSREGAP